MDSQACGVGNVSILASGEEPKDYRAEKKFDTLRDYRSILKIEHMFVFFKT